MINFFTSIPILSLYSFVSIIIGILVSVFIFFMTKDRVFFGKIFGTFAIFSLAILGNNPFVYLIALIIIATLVTELEFLEKLMALIWNREKYWDYLLDRRTAGQENAPVAPEDAARIEVSNVSNIPYTLSNYFNAIYGLIFGSQLRILNMLREKPRKKEEIYSIYLTTVHNGTYPFESYIGYLEKSGLIAYNSSNDTHSILPLGELFLDYLISKNMTFDKPF